MIFLVKSYKFFEYGRESWDRELYNHSGHFYYFCPSYLFVKKKIIFVHLSQ